MSKYELSLSKDYVPNWTIVDAVRELFQNALDQQTTTPNNEMFFSYNESEKTLYIGNKASVLSVDSLLLGKSSKRDQPDTIGQFGEGYKIATLVLSRSNKPVTFYNYGAKEVWKPRFVNSRRYGCEILTFFVDKKFIWQKVPDNNLTITIENVTPEEYEEIVDSNLHCQEVEDVTISEYGRILHDEKYKGRVFVNGLFVCNYNKYEEGYDFKPKHLKIDRDRKLADSFELEWLSSKMWSGVDSDKTVELVKKGSADVTHIASTASLYGNKNSFLSISNKVFDSFKDEHGDDAIPVTSQEEYQQISSYAKYTPVFVNTSYSSTIKASDKYIPPVLVKRNVVTSKELLEKWLKDHNKVLSKRAKSKLRKIIENVTS